MQQNYDGIIDYLRKSLAAVKFIVWSLKAEYADENQAIVP